MKNYIKVIMVEPHYRAKIANIDPSLENLQDIVGGYIQALYPYEDQVAIIADDEGKLKHYPMNRLLEDEDGIPYDFIAGTFLVVGLTETDFGSLSDELAEKYLKKFLEPEEFLRIGKNGPLFQLKRGAKPRRIL